MSQFTSQEIYDSIEKFLNQKISRETSLYEVFEDSIQMFRFLGEAKETFGIEFGMLDLVKAETIGDLVDKIQEKLGKGADVEKKIPLTPMQQSYRLGREQNFHGSVNSTHFYFEVEHALDIDKAEDCIRKLIEKHEALRAFVEDENQCILAKDISKNFKIVREAVAESDLKQHLDQKRLRAQTEMRDLGKWPLFDITNITTEKRSIAAVDLELMFVDGLSTQGLASEFLSLYHEGVLPSFDFESNPQYVEWIKSRKDSAKHDRDAEFWHSLEADIPAAPKFPVISTNDNEANICNCVQKIFSKETLRKMEITARKNGVTSSVVLFYLYLKTLARFSESGDFSVNITMLNRPYGIEGMDHIIGDYTSNVIYDFSSKSLDGLNVRDTLQKVRDRMYERIDHSAYEGVEVIRDLIRQKQIDKDNPMPIVFTSMLFGKLPEPQGLQVNYIQSQTSQVSIDNQISKTHDGGLLISWDYLEKIFPKDFIAEMFQFYSESIEEFAASADFASPAINVEKRVEAYNSTAKTFSIEHPIAYLQRSFAKFRDNIALQDGVMTTMTYAELEDSVRKAMFMLKIQGVTCGDSVAILSQKNFSTVITILATMGLGATYIPVDAKWPEDRKDYIVKNSNCKLLVEPQKLVESPTRERADFAPNPDLNATAYVIYTSGSTGVPKGVLISYAAMMNTIIDINERMGVNENSTILGLSSYCFDLSVYDIFGTLIAGGKLDIAKDIRETDEIRKFMDSSKNILWNSVPAGMELFIDSLDDSYTNSELKSVLLSGDWISVSLPERIRKHFPNAQIYSLGGATEASIWSIYFPIVQVDPSWQSIPYGYPLANQTIYVLNESLEICPPEVQGEIYIGGVGVAQGYANSEEKTKAAFIDHPKFGRIYKTGDFGRFSTNGYVVFLGRKDSQVKVGGYRIELGEIEQRMNAIASVDNAIVVLDTNKQIVAFYTGTQQDKEWFKNELSQFLPVYMIPHRFIHLDAMPLSSNGKLDRKTLMQNLSAGTAATANAVETKTAVVLTETQSVIIDIWKSVLELKEIDCSLDFFELGGDSIKAQRIAQRIDQKYGIRVPFVSVLNAQNARDFAESVEDMIVPKAAADALSATDSGESGKGREFPMTGVQLAYLNGRNEHFELGKYNAHYYFEIESQYTVPEIENAIRKVVKKHDAFRAIFLPNGTQKVLTDVPDYKMEVVKCTSAERETETLKIRNELSHHIYQHDKWPLFTFKAVDYGEDTRTVFVSFDLMVCDGDSMQIFFSDLGRVLRKQPFEERIGYSYERYVRDLSRSRDEKRYEEDKAYWMERLPTFPEYPHVPLAQKVSDCTEYTIVRKQDVICKKTWSNFKKVAKEHRISPSALLCTIYAKVLERWSNQQDMVLNLTAFERKPFHKDVEKIIGDFTKLLPLALSMNENDLWKQASDVQTRIMDGLEHLSYDGTEIMRELAKSRNQFGKAILPVVFTCVLFDAPENYYEVLGKLRYSISQTPQIFIDNQIGEMGKKLYVTWDVVKEMFEPEIIDQIFKDFVENIRYIANGENKLHFPELKNVWNNYNPAVGATPVKTLHGLVNSAMQNFKDRTAVVGKDSTLTYAELDILSNRIANYLHDNGVIRGDRVAVLGERIPETIASILGILKAGGVYVPIDVSYPKERVDFIMQDGNCKFLLKKSYLESKGILSYSDKALPAINTPKDEAYIIYTSGSTGKPKGVIMQHGATANTIIDVNERLALNENDALIGISSICFDLSVYDIFGALSSGTKLALVSDARDMREVCEVLSTQNVTVWNSVPVLFDMAMKHRISANDSRNLSLRKVLLSGDRIPLDICTTSKNAGCKAYLISLGGATEAAIWSIIYPFSEVRADWDCVPYGYPMKNQTFYVLNADLKPCPPEVQGDLYIGGVGLAKGYNNDPEKTSKAFINHPKLGRIYRTGDLGKLKTEGYIEFLGRSDTQIKLNGFRIELGEIEAALMHTGLVTRAVAALKDVPGSGKQIIAYVLGANIENAEATLKSEISKTLTGYMIPSRIVTMESFPLSANGKVDKKQLPIPEAPIAADAQNATSATANENISDEEKAMLELWQSVFENPGITLDDDFYSIGGDSITLMKLVDKIALDLKKTVSIDQILQAKSIREFITLIY